jgi:hypothetical protein
MVLALQLRPPVGGVRLNRVSAASGMIVRVRAGIIRQRVPRFDRSALAVLQAPA